MNDYVPSEPFVKGASPRGATWRGKLLRCPQLFAYDYLIGYNVFPDGPPPISDPLQIGIEVHEALEARFRRIAGERSVPHSSRFLKRPEAHRAFEQVVEGLPSWLRSAKVLGVEKSVCVWVNDRGRLVPPPSDAEARLAYAREKPRPFKAGPYPHTMRIDLEVQLVNGKVREIDWKTAWRTSGRVADDKLEGFLGNLQFTGVDAYGRAAWGDRYDGTFAILAPKAKARKKAGVLDVTPPREAQRRFGRAVVHSERTFRFLWQLYGTDFEAWPAVLSEQGPCKDRYGNCPYLKPCRGQW